MSIKKRIKKIGGKLLYAFQCWKWWNYYRSTIKQPRKQNFIISDDWYKKEKILLIAPHADDELLSSYTLLKGSPDLTVYYCGFTGSKKDEQNRVIRRHEIESLCREMNVSFVDGEGLCDNLKNIIKDFDSIVIPSVVDWHAEHRKVSYLLYDILINSDLQPNIYSYSVTVPNESEHNVLCIAMTRTDQHKKYALFNKVYFSQRFMPLFRFRLNERINGYNIYAYAAEVFLYHSLNKWYNEVKILREAEIQGNVRFQKMALAIKKINDMQKVRQSSHTFYLSMDKETFIYD